MADEMRTNRQPMQHQQARPDTGMQGDMQQQGGSKMPWVILGIVVVVLVVLGVLFRGQLFKGPASTTTANSSAYVAVFLTNGQVYFGKLTEANSDYPVLDDIYYLQVGPSQGSGATTTPQQGISLVKLGNELHGPVDEMHISKSQILFYEQLKSDGSVVKAIEAYKASPSGTPTPTPAK